MKEVLNMKVKELINKLKEYNPEAEFNIIVDYYAKPFEICIGCSDGCTNKTCENVDFVVNIQSDNSYKYVHQDEICPACGRATPDGEVCYQCKNEYDI